MSGRSAIVRKKITETRVEKQGPKSFTDEMVSSDEMHDRGARQPTQDVYSNESHSGSSDGWRESSGHSSRPLDDSAYARTRRPVIGTEDVTAIEKSGLRSMLDKKSDEVRKNLAKTFTFKKKAKNDDVISDGRPQSAATVRPVHGGGLMLSDEVINNYYDIDVMSPHAISPSSPIRPWDAWPMAPTPPIKRWIGSGRPVQRWSKLQKDPELFDPNGDVAVYLCHKDQLPRPRPSFRLSSHIIEATESRTLITLLREGSTEDDVHMASLPVGAPPMLERQVGHLQGAYQYVEAHGNGYGHGGQPTPPMSEDATSHADSDGQISYEMFFSPPSGMTRTEQLRFYLAVRNVFAMLYHASLVGLGLYDALSDLHARLDAWMPEADNLGTIIIYLTTRGIDDVRDNADMAVSLLAWSECPEVRWDEGWRESFLHCAGMHAQVEACADFKRVTPITRALLERASLGTQLRVHAAEERLAEFQFADMWPSSVSSTASTSGPVSVAPAKSSADRLQKFLVQHYTGKFGSWPPLVPKGGQAHVGRDTGEDMWLTRTLAQQLLRDFAALYDYLVDRDIAWDISEARASRKCLMISLSGNKAFDADSPDLPMTDMLIEFDNRNRFPHIPHAYPLVPDSMPVSITDQGSKTKSSASKKSANARTAADGRRVQLAYTEATNLCVLGSDFAHCDFIDAFARFEKSDQVAQVDPATARRGRWVLIYGILQHLATVTVDAPNVRYSENVSYHLSPHIKGAKLPPWRARGPQSADEASHELSYCWMVPHTWSNRDSAATSGAESSADEGPDPHCARPFNFPRPPTAASTNHASSIRSGRSIHGGAPLNPSIAGSIMSSMSESEAGSRMHLPTSSFSHHNRRTHRAYLARPRAIEHVDEHDHFISRPKDPPALSAVRGVTGPSHPDGLSCECSEPHEQRLPPVIRDFDFENLDVIDDHEP